MHVFMHVLMHIFMHVFMGVYMHVFMHVFIHVYISGIYAFIETTKHGLKSEKAIIKSVLFDPTSSVCLSFWYNMYGTSVDTLSILLNASHSEVKWEITGNQGKEWKLGRLPIVSNVKYQVQNII